ncbi:MAG: nitroreductase family protein [Nitrospinota bacterium]
MHEHQDGDLYFHFLQTRRSRRQFGPGDVPVEELDRIVQAAGWAPSPHKTCPWRFVIVKAREVQERLVQEMASAFEADLRKDGLPEERIRARIQKSLDLLLAAKGLLIACLYKEDLDRYPDDFRQVAEETMAAQSLGAAIQNILLAAHARDVASCWVCAPLFCPGTVRTVLDLPENFHPHALVAFGRPPLEEPPARPSYGLTVLHR